jgi:polyisoprenyl-teichoic acid--peptidoglycan teichoic acid transferase
MLGAAVLIVVLTVVAASTAAIETVGTVADLIGKGGFISSPVLKPAGADQPTTFLILGSDRRDKGAIDYTAAARSDTILLVHLDPNTHLWSEMSVPRDFYVQYKWKGVSYASKINSVYTLGGAPASSQVVSKLLHITINYAVDLNFTAFDEIVDKLGCVYVDVDHQYLNTPAESQLDNYASINVRPGYQALCGEHALDYVRYRHEDDTFARDAREQSFLRDAREQLGLSGLLSHASDIITALSKSIQSNIRGPTTVAGLIETVIDSVNGPVNQVQFPNNPITVDGAADQTATPAEIQAAVHQFLEPDVATPTARTLIAATSPGTHRVGSGRHKRTVHTAAPIVPDLIATPSDISSQAATLGPFLPFPIYVPQLMLNTASLDIYEPYSHYTVTDPQGHVHHGYRIDFSTGDIGSYYGIEGMDWTDPPLFVNPLRLTAQGRRYIYVTTGGHVQDIGWIVDGRYLYWVSNTIFQTLSNQQMLKLAESARSVT